VKKIGVLIAALLAGGALAVFAIPAIAGNSPSEQLCDQQGGTYTSVQGEKQCIVPTTENAGNSQSDNAHQFTDTTTTSGQGNYSPQPSTTTTSCAGPPCPAGQFK